MYELYLDLDDGISGLEIASEIIKQRNRKFRNGIFFAS
jgi:hypothetical protein